MLQTFEHRLSLTKRAAIRPHSRADSFRFDGLSQRCGRDALKAEKFYDSTAVAVPKDLDVALSIAVQLGEFKNSVSSAWKTFVSLGVGNKHRARVRKYCTQSVLLVFCCGVPWIL